MGDKLSKKVISATFATVSFILLYGILAGIFSSSKEEMFFIVIIFFFALVGNFIYAIPISFLCDALTKNFTKFRFLISAILHIFFALITSLGIFAITCAVLFFLMDEWQKRDKVRHLDKKNFVFNGIALIIIVVFSVYFPFKWVELTEEKTNDYYLIPRGYVGEITVLYNIEGAPAPKRIGDYKVIQINEIGYGITSLPESEGTIENKYYYIDSKGKKEKINDNCVHIGPSGSISGGDGSEFVFSTIKVTDVGCGDEFISSGRMYLENNSLEIEEILQREGLVGDDW
jgi:glycopeptide antibiotics resistance protein